MKHARAIAPTSARTVAQPKTPALPLVWGLALIAARVDDGHLPGLEDSLKRLDDLLVKLVKIAGISEDESAFRFVIRSLILETWTQHTMQKYGERGSKALKKAAHAVLALDEALSWLNKDERAVIHEALEQRRRSDKKGPGFGNYQWTAWYLAEAICFSAGFPGPSQPSDVREGRSLGSGRGKKPGAENVQTRGFKRFAASLDDLARIGGGGFTLTKFMKAIELLRDHLPPGFVPKVLPSATLKRIVEARGFGYSNI
jgi:hypothetical protein